MKQAHGGAPLCVIPVSHYTKTKSVCNFHLLIDDTACLIFSYPIGLFKAICLLINSSLHRPISFRLICIYLILMYLSNVTRFGEISPLWQHFNRLWENFDMVLIWYLVNFWTYFENFYANVSNFNYNSISPNVLQTVKYKIISNRWQLGIVVTFLEVPWKRTRHFCVSSIR